MDNSVVSQTTAAWVSAFAGIAQATGALLAIGVSLWLWWRTNLRERRLTEAAEARARAAEQRAVQMKLIEQFDLYQLIITMASGIVDELSMILNLNEEVSHLPNFSPGPIQRMMRGETFRLLVPTWITRIADPSILSLIASIERDTASIVFPQAGTPGRGETWRKGIAIRRDMIRGKVEALRDQVTAKRAAAGLEREGGHVAVNGGSGNDSGVA